VLKVQPKEVLAETWNLNLWNAGMNFSFS